MREFKVPAHETEPPAAKAPKGRIKWRLTYESEMPLTRFFGGLPPVDITDQDSLERAMILAAKDDYGDPSPLLLDDVLVTFNLHDEPPRLAVEYIPPTPRKKKTT
jgi:hypothetical protein